MAKLALTALAIFSLLSVSSSLSSETLSNAGETLADSGYVAMSLTLSLIPQTLLAQPSSATIFTPPDTAFSDSGQPSLSLLQLHFSPLAFSEESLRSLPFGTKIPTMSSGASLTVTTTSSTDPVSLDSVTITGSPIFDDGFLIIFGIDNFFNPNFTIPPVNQSLSFDIGCVVSESRPGTSFADYSFNGASGALKSRGYSVMAYFLDLQLIGFLGRPNLTVFAPADVALVDYAGHVPDYPSLFLRHVLPCKVSWTDLVSISNGTEVGTYLEGFTVTVTKSDDTIMVNNVSVTFPDMYYSDWLVVHGLREMLSLPETEDVEREGGSVGINGSEEESIAPERSPI